MCVVVSVVTLRIYKKCKFHGWNWYNYCQFYSDLFAQTGICVFVRRLWLAHFLFYEVTAMINVMEYKGIYGIVEYVPGAKSFQVTAISENGSICVSADTVYDINERFAAACEEYIAKCTKNNISPYIHASGSIKDIKIEPELHRKALVACKIKRISCRFNIYCCNFLTP